MICWMLDVGNLEDRDSNATRCHPGHHNHHAGFVLYVGILYTVHAPERRVTTRDGSAKTWWGVEVGLWLVTGTARGMLGHQSRAGVASIAILEPDCESAHETVANHGLGFVGKGWWGFHHSMA